jgi:hypothetical protein
LSERQQIVKSAFGRDFAGGEKGLPKGRSLWEDGLRRLRRRKLVMVFSRAV